MKTKRTLLHVCRRVPALWLVVGLGFYGFPAGKAHAQVVITSLSRQMESISEAWDPYLGSVTDHLNISPVDGSTNISTQAAVAGAAASSSSSQTSQILPILFSSSGSVSASSDLSTNIGAAASGYGYSAFAAQFYVTARVRFNYISSASVSVDGYAGASTGQYNLGLSESTGGLYVSFLKSYSPAGSNSVATNLSGILMPGKNYDVRGEISMHEGVNDTSPQGTQTGSAAYAFQIKFYPLPAGDNEILGERLSGGDMRFTYVGSAGTNYALDRTFNLSPPNWVPQLTNAADPSGVLVFTNTPVPTTNNFWRIRSVP